MSDRLDRAHALRAEIHRWLKQHPHANMAGVAAAFPDSNPVTVRKAMQTLSRLGSVARHGASIFTSYTAIGDEIYRPEDMRQKMRTGHANLLHDYNRDRLAQTWEKRNAIHRYITANPLARMAGIVEHFSDTPAATVRKHVKVLCSLGHTVMHGKGIRARYAAATAEIYSVESLREKQRAVGRAVGNFTARRRAQQEAESQAEIAADPPGKYTNRPDKHRPHPYQGGQYSRSCHSGVSTLERFA